MQLPKLEHERMETLLIVDWFGEKLPDMYLLPEHVAPDWLPRVHKCFLGAVNDDDPVIDDYLDLVSRATTKEPLPLQEPDPMQGVFIPYRINIDEPAYMKSNRARIVYTGFVP